MKTDYTIRPMKEEDTGRVVSLLQIGLGVSQIPRTREFWEWKHLRSPFGPSPALLAESNGEIIGLRVFMRWVWRVADRDVSAVRAVDTVTHPDWRGKGIFSHLTTTLLEELQKEGVSFVFNTPNSSSLPGYLKMGWNIVTRLPLWIRPLHPIRMMRKFIFKNRKPDSHAGNSFPITTAVLENYSSEESLETRFHTVRSHGYLKWRYQQIPGFSYEAKSKKDKSGEALIIFRLRNRTGLLELSISELLSNGPSGVPLAQELLNELARFTTADYMIAMAAKDTEEETVLKKSGFYLLRRFGPVLTLKSLNAPVVDFQKWSNWRCSIGDLEMF